MKDNFKSKYGFSMAELLICLGLIAALAGILIPSLGQFKPDRNKGMFKKAYLLTERIVYELVNDEDLYKSGTGVVGFDNVETINYNGLQIGGKTKFCKLFADKLNTTSSGTGCKFTTTDGIYWELPETNFADAQSEAPAWRPIKIDVNAKNKKTIEDNAGETCNKNADTFTIYVSADGSVIPAANSGCAVIYVKEQNMAINDKETNKKIQNENLFKSVSTTWKSKDNDGPEHVVGTINSSDWYDQSGKGNCNPKSPSSCTNN